MYLFNSFRKSEENQNFTERKFMLQHKEELEQICLENNNSNSDNIEPPSLTILPHGSLLSQSEVQV